MNENNNQGMQAPKELTDKEKAQKAGADAAEVVTKAVLPGQLGDVISKMPMAKKQFAKAGKKLYKASSPLGKKVLAKAQPTIEKAKPMLNAAAGSIGGGAGGATGAANAAGSKGTGLENSNSSTSALDNLNNSGFGNNKSGLFSPSKNSSEGGSGSASGDLVKGFKKAKTIIAIISMISPILFPMLICLVVAFVVMGQIMIIRDNINKLVEQFTTGVEKFGNLLQGEGWATEEEAFFNHLNEEYESFPYTGGGNLDIALISATIHYSTTVDLSEFEESENNLDESTTVPGTTGVLDRKQTVAFYNDAKEKLGKVNTIWPGQKRLLGHVVKTEVTWDMIDVDAAGGYWAQFFSYLSLTYISTVEDAYWNTTLKYNTPLSAIANFIDMYNRAKKYVEDYGNIFYELEYDAANLWYEAKEFVNNFANLFEACNDSTTTDANGNLVAVEDQNGFFKIPAPVVSRTMNYGYDEYKQMQRDMAEMKKILSASDIRYETNSDVLENAKNSSNTELKKLYEDYNKQENAYLYSYTHYLQNVYVPFRFCYNAECDRSQIDKMVDEIFEQRDFYYYLMGDESDITAGCGYSYSGDPVDIEINVEMIKNLYVNVLHYEENSRTSTNIAETVSLKDYVTGVLYREVGASTSDNAEYLKANIVAIKSYTIGRPKVMGDTITNDGEKYYLTMRNNTNDQVYCSLTNGCMDAPSNKKPAPSQELISYIGKLYDEVASQFLYDTDTNNFTGSYRDKTATCTAAGATGRCMGQRESKDLGEKGNNWETILASFYENSIGIVDITTSKLSTSVMSCITPGLQLGHSGYSVRTNKPTSGSKYFVPPLNGSTLGQCAWYAKGRALEIVDTVNAPQEKKDLAIQTIKQIYANGNHWYHEKLLEVFAHGTDYKLPREGSIVVYDWVKPDEKGNRYGHVAIVEKVEGDKVYVSDGWNKCGGAYGQATWECVGYGYRALTIEQMQNMGRPEKYKFIGYVYLLD